MAQLAVVPVVVNSPAPAQAPAEAADDGAFDLVLAALTPDLAAPQAPAAVPLPKDVKAAPVEPAPKDADVVKLLPRPVPAARADARLPAAAKLAAPKIETPALKPAITPSTDDKDGVAVAPIRVVTALMAKPDKLAVAEAAKPPVAEAPPAPPPAEAAVPVAVQVKPDTKPVPDKAPRAAPQAIVQDATPVQEIEHDTPPQEHQASEPAPPQQPHQPPAHQAVQVATPTNVAHLPTSVAASAPAPEPAAHSDPQPDIKALAAQIVAKAASGAKTFEIRLDPPELGRVEVRLTVSHDGKAEATLTAERPETVALLQRDSQNLERTLKEAGLDVSNSSLNFSLKGEERQGDGGGASRAHTRNLSDTVVARSETVNASLANRSAAPASGRLDIFV